MPLAGTAPIRAPLPLPDKPSLAVLPFQNMTDDPDQEYFVDVSSRRSRPRFRVLPWVFVIARNSSFTYKGKAVDVKQVHASWECATCWKAASAKPKTGCAPPAIDRHGERRTSGPTASTASWTTSSNYRTRWRRPSSVRSSRSFANPRSSARPESRPTASTPGIFICALTLRYQYTEESISAAISLLERALAIDPSCAPAAAMIGSCRLHNERTVSSRFRT